MLPAPLATCARGLRRHGDWLVLLACIWTVPALAADPPLASTSDQAGTPEQRQQQPPTDIAAGAPAEEEKGFWQRETLLGDLGGLRSRLAEAGVTVTLQEQSEVFGNVSGGVHRGVAYEGATLLGLGVDLEKLAGLTGGAFNVSAYQIHGRGLGADNLGNLNVPSGIEAPRSTRLFELWYEQKLLGDMVSVRIGQQAADQEFIVTKYGGLFLNAGFGWPTLPAVDLPSGGNAYPLATPGVRVKVSPTDSLSILAGLYNGDPADNGAGTSFRLNKGVFLIAEAQYAINQGEQAAGLPGLYKFGAWYNSNAFDDQRRGIDGLSLADPDSVGVPRRRRNNWSLYAVADQLLLKEPGTTDQGLGVFAQIMGAPGDRNLVNFSVNAGVTYKGIVPGRGDDTAGLAVGYTRISDTASQHDSDVASVSGGFFPIRRNETVLEITYQAQIAPWWFVQPDFQYIFNPGGGVLNPSDPAKKIGDAAVFGLRTTLLF